MKNGIARIALIFLSTILLVGFAFAGTPVFKSGEKAYIIRITSKDPNKIVNFSGTYMHFSNTDGYGSNPMQNITTPFEIKVKAYFLGTMFATIESPITVTILEKDEHGEQSILSATGLFTFAHVDTEGNVYSKSALN